MTRNLKLLGLALAAMLAFGVVSASAASAYQATYTTEGGVSANLTGTGLTGVNAHKITLGTDEMRCEKATFAGKISASTTQITLSPVFESCTGSFGALTGLPVTITMNACYFLYSISAGGAEEEDEYDGALHIQCPEGKQIEVHVFASVTAHSENKPTCTFGVFNQTLTEGKVINDTEAEDVTLKTNSLFTVTRIAGPEFICGKAEQTGIYHGTTTVNAKTTGIGNPVGFHVG